MVEMADPALTRRLPSAAKVCVPPARRLAFTLPVAKAMTSEFANSTTLGMNSRIWPLLSSSFWMIDLPMPNQPELSVSGTSLVTMALRRFAVVPTTFPTWPMTFENWSTTFLLTLPARFLPNCMMESM